jgi:hypothetical protein
MPNCSIPGATESTSRTASRLRLATPGLPTASRPARGRTCWSAFTASSANSHPRSIAQKPLDRVDRHRAGQLRSVAHALARVIADPAVNRSQRVVSNQLPPGPFGIAGLQVRQPSLDVLTGRAAGVARRQQIDVHRAMLPNGPALERPCTRSGSGVTSRGAPDMPGFVIAIAESKLSVHVSRRVSAAIGPHGSNQSHARSHPDILHLPGKRAMPRFPRY